MAEPKLRFKYEDGTEFPEWECTRVGEVFTKITEKNKNGDNTNVITNSAEFGLINQRDFFDKDIAVEGKTENYTIIKTNDFVYNPRKSSLAPFGAFNGYILKDDGIVSPLYFCLRLKKSDMSADYLLWYFKTSRWHRFIYENGEQSGARHDRVGVSDEVIKGIPIDKPCLEEQKKIADFLSTVDEVISQSEAEVQNLAQQKKAAMQKIFSQEIRFRREDGREFPEWESHTIGDLFYKVNERNNGQFDKTKWISVAKMYYQVPDKVTSNNIDTRTYVMRLGDMAFEGHPNSEFLFGRFVVNDIGDGVISELFPIYRHKTNYVLKYWKYAIQIESVMAHIYRRSITTSGASSNKLNDDDFLNESILVPCLEEQQKIADFLSAYDEAISYAKQELGKWKELKKGLLQQMFV